MTARRAGPGGTVTVEVAPGRLVAWVNRFGVRNGGLAGLTADPEGVTLTGGDGTAARIGVPFGPMTQADAEPLEALLAHIDGLGDLGILLVRGGAHSVGVARAGAVLTSSTDRPYLSGRTAAGGWSQGRYARRRQNQRSYSLDSAARTAARVLLPAPAGLAGLVLGGDRAALTAVLDDPRLRPLLDLPRRVFPDVAEPRRAVLDAVAKRALSVPITVTPPP